jgi:ferrous iron transport protein B
MSATATTALQTVALAGNPNSGKTTIFNALTGLRQKVANYPGVTVEKRVGAATLDDGTHLEIIDLPGTYSLIATSPDERVACDVILGRQPGTNRPDAVIVVVDASNLQRNLYLLTQVIELRVPFVVALNMMDVAERRGIRVDPDELSRQIGVPVVPVVGHKGKGIDQLKRAIAKAVVPPSPEWPLPEPMRRAVDEVSLLLTSDAKAAPVLPAQVMAERLLAGEPVGVVVDPEIDAKVRGLRATLERDGVDPVQADVEAHYRWIETVAHRVASPVVDVRVKGTTLRGTGVPHVADGEPIAHVPEARATRADQSLLDYASRVTMTERVDRILLHKVWGLLTFAAVMGLLFVSIFTLAAPVMDATKGTIGWAGGLVAAWIGEGTLQDLWTGGIVRGVGGVLVFVPQIAILFLFLAILEDSGYLARAAFLMDRVLGKVGLNGKAFIPMLSAHACAIPAIMATRTIESRRERMATIFVAPFMSCSARLPVYGLLIGTFFGAYSGLTQGLIMLGCYLLGIVAAVLTAWVWKLWTTNTAPSSFILELPTYKAPQPWAVARVVGRSTWAFVRRAGTIIFCLSVILWALTYWPRLPKDRVAAVAKPLMPSALVESYLVESGKVDDEVLPDGMSQPPGIWKEVGMSGEETERYLRESEPQLRAWADSGQIPEHHRELAMKTAAVQQAVAGEQLRHSFAGRLGHLIEPAIKPLGYDWKIGVGLIGSFAAREVFVSTMGIVYSVGDDDENTDPLAAAMLADVRPDGTKVWTPLVATSVLIWFVLAMQCMSTLAIVKRETGRWRWPLAQLAYMTGLAYVLCLAVYQVGRLFVG